MKPIIFRSENRPELFIQGLRNKGPQTVSLAEIGPGYAVVISKESLSLRGELLHESTSVPFQKREEENVGKHTYTEIVLSREDSERLILDFLKRLPSQDLTEWILSQAEENTDQEKKKDEPFKSSEETSFVAITLTRVLCYFYRHPWIGLVCLLLFSVFPVWQLKDLKIDPSLDRIYVQESQAMRDYKKSINLFGSDKSAILYFESPDIFSPKKLQQLRELAWDLQKYPHSERVQTVFTTTFIRNEDDTLYTEPAFASETTNEEKIKDTLTKIQKDPNLHGRLIDVPKNTIIFNIQIDKDLKSLEKVGRDMNKKLAPLEKDFKISFQTGEPMIEVFAADEMKISPFIFLPLIALILLICFVYFIRSASAFFVTLIVTFFSTLWAFGFMTWMNIPIQLLNNLVPGIVLTLSATEIVHLFSSLKTAKKERLSGENAIEFVGFDIGKALFLTFTSTSLGFLSIRLSEILLLQEFAIVSFLGLSLAFFATLITFPVHFRFFGERKASSIKNPPQSAPKLFKKALSYFDSLYLNIFFSKWPTIIIGIFTLINLILASQIRVDNDSFEMIADRTQVKKNLNYFKKQIGGMKAIHVVIKTKNGEKFSQPNNLNKLWEVHNEVDAFKKVKHTESFAGLMALLNKEMRSGEDKDYKVPQSPNLISQYMVILSRDDLDPFLSPDRQTANLKLFHDISSSHSTDVFLSKLEKELYSHLDKDHYSFYFTSRNILNIHAAHTIITSQASSLITMSLVILVLVSLFFRSITSGFLALIPNLFPIVGLFGIMGLLDIPLNFGTCIVAAITIGIAADDTIHLFTRYFKDKNIYINPFDAGNRTIEDEVTPILTTSLSLALSFCVFSFARFLPLMQFGLLSAYVLLLAVISDLYLGPAILTAFYLKKEQGFGSYFHLLFDPKALKKGQVFKPLNLSEINRTLQCGHFKSYQSGNHTLSNDNELAWYIPVKGSVKQSALGSPLHAKTFTTHGSCVIFRLDKQKFSHLYPRIFQKFCNNLEKHS